MSLVVAAVSYGCLLVVMMAGEASLRSEVVVVTDSVLQQSITTMSSDNSIKKISSYDNC